MGSTPTSSAMENISIISFAVIFLGLANFAGATTEVESGLQSLQTSSSTSTRPTGDPDFDLLKTTSTSTSPTPSGDPDFDLLKTAPQPPPPPPPSGLTASDGGVGELSDKSIGDPDFDLLNIDLGGDDLEKFRAEVSTADPVKKVTVRGWDPEKKEEIVGRPEDVKSAEDLQIYVEATALNDVAIKGIKIKENAVEVESRESGKLFWFIPVEMSSIIIVKYKLEDSTEDRVKVRFPWWHVFVKKPYNNGPSGIQIEITAALDVAVWQKVDNSEAPVDMSRISQTLQVISNVMKTKHDTVKNSISNIR